LGDRNGYGLIGNMMMMMMGDRNHPRKSVNSSCFLSPATGSWTHTHTHTHVCFSTCMC
jgi:hypothetical protein